MWIALVFLTSVALIFLMQAVFEKNSLSYQYLAGFVSSMEAANDTVVELAGLALTLENMKSPGKPGQSGNLIVLF